MSATNELERGKDFLVVPDDMDFDFGKGDFTISCFIDGKHVRANIPRDPFMLRDCIRDVLKRKKYAM